MKKAIIISAILAATFSIGGCNYLEDPTIDEEGNRIPLVAIGTPDFPTQINISIRDQFGNAVTSDFAFKIVGDGAANLVNAAGKKKSSSIYSMSSGRYTLYLDPNVTPSEQNPVELTFVTAEITDSFIFPISLNITTEGIYQVPLTLYKESSATKGTSEIKKQSDVRNNLFVTDNLGSMHLGVCGEPFITNNRTYYNFGSVSFQKYGVTTLYLSCSVSSKYGFTYDNGLQQACDYCNILRISDFTTGDSIDKLIFGYYELPETTPKPITPVVEISGKAGLMFSGTFSITEDSGRILSVGDLCANVDTSVHLPVMSIDPNAPCIISFTNAKDSPGIVQMDPIPITAKIRLDLEANPAASSFTTYHIKFDLYDPAHPEAVICPTLPISYLGESDLSTPIWVSLKDGEATLSLIKGDRYVFATIWDGKKYSSAPIPTDPVEVQQFIEDQAAATDGIKIDALNIKDFGSVVEVYIKASSSFVSELQ